MGKVLLAAEEPRDENTPGIPSEGQTETDGESSGKVSAEPETSERSTQAKPMEAAALGWGTEGGIFRGLALSGSRKGKRLVRKKEESTPALTAEQRLLILDTWRRSGLAGGDFEAIVGISKHTLYSWKKKFDEHGPAGLMEARRGAGKGSRLPELTRRTILMLKESNPAWGCEKISDMLVRGPALPASASAVARVLHEAGYELEERHTHPHKEKVQRFERSRPNELWETDLFTFILRRQNRRVYLVAFLDDHSRFLVSFGLWASPSTALVLETLRSGIAAFGQPEEVLTDNGPQYITWRGKSAFAKECEKRGIKQIVAAPRHPRTLGKIERFWGTLWRECLETAVFFDVDDARRRIALFVDAYNFSRPHQGLDGMVPADRFFGAAPEVLKTMKARVAVNAAELARNGIPKPPLYLTGQVAGKPVSLHTEGESVVMVGPQGRQEIDLKAAAHPEATALPDAVCPQGILSIDAPEPGSEEPAEPGTSALDDLADEAEGLSGGGEGGGQ